MSFESDLFTLVTSDATCSGIIGTRLYPNVLQQSAGASWPGCSCVYKTITGTYEQTHDSLPTLRRLRVQFDAYSRDAADVEAMVDALGALLMPLKSDMGSTHVRAVLHVNESGSYEQETRLSRGIVEFEFWYQP